MLAKSDILGHFLITFWYHFGPRCSFLVQKGGIKKRSKKQGPKSHAGRASFTQVVRLSGVQVPITARTSHWYWWPAAGSQQPATGNSQPVAID